MYWLSWSLGDKMFFKNNLPKPDNYAFTLGLSSFFGSSGLSWQNYLQKRQPAPYQ